MTMKGPTMRPMMKREQEHFPHNPTMRGYNAVYRQHETNHCPGCGRTHWHVGRVSAECGFCSTALPFAGSEFAMPTVLSTMA